MESLELLHKLFLFSRNLKLSVEVWQDCSKVEPRRSSPKARRFGEPQVRTKVRDTPRLFAVPLYAHAIIALVCAILRPLRHA